MAEGVVRGLLEELSGFDHVRFTWSDLHGIQRGITVPQRNVPQFLESGVHAFCGTNCMGVRSQVTMVDELVKRRYDNMRLQPRPGTSHALPWAGAGKSNMGEVLCNCYWRDGAEMQACAQNAALRQIQRLEECGYRLLSSWEMEYTLYNAQSKPVFTGSEFYSTLMMSECEDYLLELEKELKKAGVDVECFHTEYGSGQLEVTFVPEWGIKMADNGFIFKAAAKEIARKLGYKAVFMTKPSEDTMTNGMHYTFSLWDKDGKSAMKGADGKFTAAANHFLAGMCHHGAAITALCAPTLNCYRRFFHPWAPCSISWAEIDRMVAFRTKTYGSKGGCIENRLPGSAANPYLAVAATLAAGIDGLNRRLELPKESTGADDGTTLPPTLQDAMAALQKDDVIKQALGPELVEWFVASKTQHELTNLPGYDPKVYNPDLLDKEFDLYSRLL